MVVEASHFPLLPILGIGLLGAVGLGLGAAKTLFGKKGKGGGGGMSTPPKRDLEEDFKELARQLRRLRRRKRALVMEEETE